MYTLFNIEEENDSIILTWSLLQVSMAVYSVMLAFGSVALKVVLLYAKVYVKIVIVFYLAVGVVICVLSILAAYLAED